MPDALAGKLLVANPGVADPNFAKSVVLVCESGVNGAFGLVLNRPLPSSAAAHLAAFVGADLLQGPVSDGGPQERTKLMALGLARRGFSAPWWRAVTSEIGLLDGRTRPDDLATHLTRARHFVGRAEWGPGLLPTELLREVWHVVEPDPADPFTTAPNGLWDDARRRQPAELGALTPTGPALN